MYKVINDFSLESFEFDNLEEAKRYAANIESYVVDKITNKII